MAKFKNLDRDEIEKMSETDRKNYYKKYIDSLLLEEKQIQRELVVKAKAKEIADRKKINHAMYLVAGELFNSEFAVPFLKSLSSKTRFMSRHTEDLNLLMESKGLGNVIKFIPCEETKKNKDKDKTKEEEKKEELKVEETSSKTKEE